MYGRGEESPPRGPQTIEGAVPIGTLRGEGGNCIRGEEIGDCLRACPGRKRLERVVAFAGGNKKRNKQPPKQTPPPHPKPPPKKPHKNPPPPKREGSRGSRGKDKVIFKAAPFRWNLKHLYRVVAGQGGRGLEINARKKRGGVPSSSPGSIVKRRKEGVGSLRFMIFSGGVAEPQLQGFFIPVERDSGQSGEGGKEWTATGESV